jgi:hypothetical protein
MDGPPRLAAIGAIRSAHPTAKATSCQRGRPSNAALISANSVMAARTSGRSFCSLLPGQAWGRMASPDDKTFTLKEPVTARADVRGGSALNDIPFPSEQPASCGVHQTLLRMPSPSDESDALYIPPARWPPQGIGGRRPELKLRRILDALDSSDRHRSGVEPTEPLEQASPVVEGRSEFLRSSSRVDSPSGWATAREVQDTGHVDDRHAEAKPGGHVDQAVRAGVEGDRVALEPLGPVPGAARSVGQLVR